MHGLVTIEALASFAGTSQEQIGPTIGAIASFAGIIYGIKAKEFTRHGHYGFSRKQPEKIRPRWWDRLIVVTISTIGLITSLYLLIHRR